MAIKVNNVEVIDNSKRLKNFISAKPLPKEITVTTTSTTLDFSEANNFHLLLQSNTTFTLASVVDNVSASGIIVLQQDGVGNRVITLASQMKTPINGAAIAQTLTANSVSVLSYYILDSNSLLVNYVGGFA